MLILELCTHVAVGLATAALRYLAESVVVGARVNDVRARARTDVAARRAVTTRRAGTDVQRSSTQTAGEPFQTAAAERVLDVQLAGGVVETR